MNNRGEDGVVETVGVSLRERRRNNDILEDTNVVAIAVVMRRRRLVMKMVEKCVR